MAKKVYSKRVQETLDAIPNVNFGDLRVGLVAAMEALQKGEITPDECKAIVNAVNKRNRALNAALRRCGIAPLPRVRVPTPRVR